MKNFCLYISLMLVMLSSLNLDGQTFFTKDGTISFYSHTPLEEIEAVNQKAVSILDLDQSKVEFSVLVKGFLFKNALMQTHFNENYMESDKFPKAIFKSLDADFSNLDLDHDGEYTIPIKGLLTVKDQEKEITTEVHFLVKNGLFSANCEFVVSPEDFKIEIPSLVKGKIADEIKVKVAADYQIYTKS